MIMLVSILLYYNATDVEDIVLQKNLLYQRKFNMEGIKSGYLAAVTVIQNEAFYIREWLEFHRPQGFDFFVIFDNNSTDNIYEELKPFIRNHVVAYYKTSGFGEECDTSKYKQGNCQNVAFIYTKHQLRNKFRWLGIFDVDEFVYAVNPKSTLRQELKTNFHEKDIVQIKSAVFGHSHQLKKLKKVPGDKINPLVIKSHLRRVNVNVFMIQRYYNDQFGLKFLINPSQSKYKYVQHSSCSKFGCASHISPLASDIRMNHYQYRSIEEQIEKSIKNGNKNTDLNPKKDFLFNQVIDFSILPLVPRLEKNLVYIANHDELPNISGS
jgi:hypothetical protein